MGLLMLPPPKTFEEEEEELRETLVERTLYESSSC